MIKKDHKYESCFAELLIKPLVSEAKDRCLALASLVDIQKFIPAIDTKANLDILPVAFNACVINRVNKNRDVVSTPTALAMYKQFINKPINLEHNRQRVIGVIMTAGFSEFGTDKPLTELEIKDMKGPFNITLGGIIWRVVCPELADHIEEASDPTSEHYLSVSASWELGFTDYEIVTSENMMKNLAEAKEIITDPTKIEEVRETLTSCGGDGKYNDMFVYRMPTGDVLPLGIGFTEKPAAEVKGVATLSAPLNEPQATAEEQVGTLESKNKISQNIESNVNPERIPIMKIESIKDITDETLKQCSASAVSDFIAAELTKGSAEWEKQKNALNTQLAEAQANSQKLQAEQVKLQEQLKQVQASLDVLNTEKAEREKVEAFNIRMAKISEAYELDDEVRAAIVEDIKAIASDEEFTKWEAKAKVLLKGFAKKAKDDKKDDKKDDGKKDGCGKDDDAKASADASKADMAKAVDNAVDNGKKDSGLPNGSSASQPSLMEKYKGAFAKENFSITI